MIASLLFLALSIVAPQDGASVPTLREEHKKYLKKERAERFRCMENISDRAKIFTIGSTQAPLKLSWAGETNAIYSLSITSDGENEEHFSLTNRTNAYITNLEIGRTYRWTVRCLNSEESVTATFMTEDFAPRLLRAGGVSNFRDVGGWKTSTGKCVRQNLIFRSAGLRFSSKNKGGLLGGSVELGARRVTDAGLETLRTDFKIATDLELRTTQETAGMTTSLLGPNVRWRCIPFVAYDLIDNVVRGREPFAKIFSLFTKKSNYPILMHCSGGRDRTGTLTFLLNGLLGVCEDDLCKDWEASIFSDDGMTFNHGRLERLLSYLHTMPGNNLNEQIESYALGCGITAEEIAAFRAIMLE